MNVALVMERIETWRGGAEMSTVQFAGHLARLGVNVTMLTTSHFPSTPAMTVVPIRAGAVLGAGKTWLFARRVAAYVRSGDFDVVHAITPCLVADVYQPRGGTVPEMLERNLAIRPDPVRRGFKRLGQRTRVKYRMIAGLERRLLTRRPPPVVIAISQYVADQLIRHYHLDASHIRLIFNGVDPDQTPADDRRKNRIAIRRQLGLADDDLVLLCVAHNFKLKGVARLIEALARRRARGADHVYAVVVGRDNPSPFVGLAQHLKVADRVLFAGPTDRPQAFLHAADVLVHPTYYDPCSRVVLEARASGLPVITTRFNGAAERIDDGRDGYVIDSPDDIEALADRIDRLSDHAHRQQCARRTQETCEATSMGRHATQILALYEEILGSKK